MCARGRRGTGRVVPVFFTAHPAIYYSEHILLYMITQGLQVSTGSGAVRSNNASVLEALKISTVAGIVELTSLRVGSRAVVQVRVEAALVCGLTQCEPVSNV